MYTHLVVIGTVITQTEYMSYLEQSTFVRFLAFVERVRFSSSQPAIFYES